VQLRPGDGRRRTAHIPRVFKSTRVKDHNDALLVDLERKLRLWMSACSCVQAMDDTGQYAFRTSSIHHIKGGVIDFYDTALVDIEQNTKP